MPAIKPDEEACPLCGEMVSAKRISGVWEFTCRGTHATGNELMWTWEGNLGAEATVPSWLQPPPLTAAQQAKADKKAAADAAKAVEAAKVPESAERPEPAELTEPAAPTEVSEAPEVADVADVVSEAPEVADVADVVSEGSESIEEPV